MIRVSAEEAVAANNFGFVPSLLILLLQETFIRK